MTRRPVGVALAATGALLLTWSGAVYARGAIARDRARAAWEQQLAHAAVLDADRASRSGTRIVSRAPGAPIARLVIPTSGLDEVVVEGVGSDELNAGPGHLPVSVAPGERGNAVISAHRDRHFSRLDRLAVGDTITTETLADVVRWVVVSRRVVPRERRVLADHGRPELTLTTCWPMRWVGSAPDRLIISAQPVERQPLAVITPSPALPRLGS